MSAERIAELEILMMQHEDSIESLSTTLHRQQLHIKKLEKTLETLAERMKTMQDSAIKPQDEETPPPHY
ncbi:MAG: SlyX family protein [Thiotrichaceae bacterium]